MHKRTFKCKCDGFPSNRPRERLHISMAADRSIQHKFKSGVRMSLIIDSVEWFNQSLKLMLFNRFAVQCNSILAKSAIHNWLDILMILKNVRTNAIRKHYQSKKRFMERFIIYLEFDMKNKINNSETHTVCMVLRFLLCLNSTDYNDERIHMNYSKRKLQPKSG